MYYDPYNAMIAAAAQASNENMRLQVSTPTTKPLADIN